MKTFKAAILTFSIAIILASIILYISDRTELLSFILILLSQLGVIAMYFMDRAKK